MATASRDASTAQLTPVLMALSVGVFVAWQITKGGPFQEVMQDHFLLRSDIGLSAPWTLITYAFSHISVTHLLFNMFGLYIFGFAVEERIGRVGLLQLYLGGAVMGALAQLYAYGGDPGSALGASGSVVAITLVYAWCHPRRSVLFLMVIPMPAPLFALVFVGLDVFGASGQLGSTGIAHAAHLGGALAGALFTLVFRPPVEGGES